MIIVKVESSNFKGYSLNTKFKNSSPKSKSLSNNKILGESHLPVRSKSRSTIENRKNIRIINDDKKSNKVVSTWSDLSTDSSKMKTNSKSLIKLNKINQPTIKTQITSRQPQIRKSLSNKNVKLQIKSVKKFQVPKHRNNSSCGKLIKIDSRPIIDLEKSNELKNESSVDRNSNKINGNKNKLLSEKSFNSKSIFRIFKMKINLFREQHHIPVNKETKSPNDSSMKIQSDNSVSKIHGYKIIEHPLTKDFLFKLYDECRQLNKNIDKLSSETNDFNKRFKSLVLANNLLDKYQTYLSNTNKENDKIFKSSISLNKSKSFSNDNDKNDSYNKHQQSQSEFKSQKVNCKTLPENDGHYYHLACVLSTDRDAVNSSINYTKTENKITVTKFKSKSIKTDFEVNDELTNGISSKRYSSVSMKTSRKLSDKNEKKINVLDNNIQEFDDTLCDLDDEMKTDSLEEIKVNNNNKDFKSLTTLSTYLTANENIKSKTRDKTNQSKLETVMNSSSFELPSSLSNKEFGNGILSQMSYPDIEPPELVKNSSIVNSIPPVSTISQLPQSQFITIYEKQFPQKMIIVNSLEKQCGSTIVSENQNLPKYSSSITVNCNKEDKSISNISQNLENTRLFFNPFKPPKCNSLKLLQFLNNNNNNSTNLLDNTQHTDEFNLTDDNINIESADNNQETIILESSTSDIPLKRVAPLKQLLMHSRNSDKMNSVFNENEDRKSPINNSYIEKQRQKKLIKQQEQHQKAKDMAVEAARLRKERQSEIQSLDSFDSTRIVERLFTENKDLEYPEFSLYDACHFNFTKRKPKKPKPLMQSTITGILPVEPEAPPEPPKSPVTNEKFRNKPIELVKHIHVKKEISKQELEKYEPIGFSKPPNNLEEKPKFSTDTNETIKSNQNDKCKKDKKALLSFISNYSSSNSDNSSSDTVSSISTSSETSESESSESSLSISLSSIKLKRKTSKYDSKLKAMLKENKIIETMSKSGNIEKNDKNLNLEEFNENSRTILNESKTVSTVDNKKNKSEFTNKDTKKSNLKKENLRLDDIKFDDIFKKHDFISKKNDAIVSTEDEIVNCNEKTTMKSDEIQCNESDIYDHNNTEYQNSNTKIGCHLNYQGKYNENILDRTLSVNINIPIPDTSLSAFVQELNTQLHSLADTVDILMNRMDVFEANLMDATKYFVLK